MSNSIAMPSVVISPAMDSMVDSVNRLNAYAQSVTQSMKLITESPTVQAFVALGKKHQEHTRILQELVKNPRFKMEMQLLRKQERGNGLFALLHKVIERVLFLISRIRTVINVKTHPENKSGRARMMGLRGLALSCAPNAKRVSDMYFSMVATRRLA